MAAGSPLFTRIIMIIFAGMFFITGCFAVASTAKRHLRNYRLVRSGVTAQGVVIDYKMTHSSRRGSIWPVVAFPAADGRQVTFESRAHLSYSGYSMGASVPVIYEPGNPANAEINEPERLYGGKFAYALGAVFILFSFGAILYALL